MMEGHLKVKDMIQKLKSLDCPLLGSGEDAWVTEILFKPNFDRYHLMEWIFSKLGFSIPKEDECQNSSEVKVKNLLAAVSALGLCSKDQSDVIQGMAPFKEQLNLWKLLVDLLWKKSTSSGQREASLSTHGTESNSISEQYKNHCNYINRLCESVNFNHLFKEKVKLFPPYLLKESKEASLLSTSVTQSLKEIKALSLEKSNSSDLKTLFRHNDFDKDLCSAEWNNSVIPNDDILNKQEEDINLSLIQLQKHSRADFNDAYNNLKLYLNVPSDESVNVGPSFQAAKSEIESFLELKDSLCTLKSSESELKALNSDLHSFQVPCEPLSDSLLRDYSTVLDNENLKKQKE